MFDVFRVFIKMVYISGPQSPGCGPAPVRRSIGTRLHRKNALHHFCCIFYYFILFFLLFSVFIM